MKWHARFLSSLLLCFISSGNGTILVISSVLVSADVSTSLTSIVCPSGAAATAQVNTDLIFSFTARDSQNNAVSQSDPNFSIGATLRISSPNYITPPNITQAQNTLGQVEYDAGTGQFKVILLTFVAGTYDIQVLYNGAVVGNQKCTVIFTPGPVTSLRGYISAPQLQAGHITSFDVVALDAVNNPVPIAQSDISATLTFTQRNLYSAATPANPVTTAIVTTVDNERKRIQFGCNVAGNVRMVIQYQQSLNAFDTPQLGDTVVLSGLPDPTEAVIDWTYLLQSRTPDLTVNQLQVTSYDAYGNKVPSSNDQRIPYRLVFQLLDSQNRVTSFNYTFLETPSSSGQLLDSTFISYGPIGRAGRYQVSVYTADQQLVGNSPMSQAFVVVAGPLEAALSTLSGLPVAGGYFQVNQPAIVSIAGRDAYGNDRTDGQGSQFVTVELLNGLTGTSQYFNITDYNNGTFSSSIVFPTSGNFSIVATIFNLPVLNSGKWWPVVAATDPSQSIVEGEGTTQCRQGSQCRFVVLTRDLYGQPQSVSPVSDQVQVLFPNVQGASYDVLPLNLGQYSVVYGGLQYGQVQMQVLVNGQAIQGSPFKIDVAPSNLQIGILSAVVLSMAIILAMCGYVAYRHWQVRRLRLQWEQKKRQVYTDYRSASAQDLLTARGAGASTEQEWEGKEGAAGTGSGTANGTQEDLRTKGEFNSMQRWIK